MEDKNTTKKSEVALREEKILEFWKENKTFEKSLAKDSPKGNYVFYDGPPFATGLMHYGHILGSTAKDAVGRYQTMRGYHVPRKWGWDCHGLPIENIVEKDLNIAGHKEIEKLGIDKFVEHARSKVLEYDKEWEASVERIGRWVDFKGGYKTMDNTFIESVWWAFSELNKKGLVYEEERVLAYCARCETPIANSEIAMDNSYKDIADISIYVKFELEDEHGTYLLAWTTTPWTLPGNTAIAVNKDIQYVKIEYKGAKYILAKDNLVPLIKEFDGAIIKYINGSELVGKKYKPVFPYYKNADMPNKKNIWKVWHADFVTTEKGTGIAHEAPAFGEEDSELAKANDIPWIIHVDETGRFKSEITDFAGLKVKPKDTAEDKDAHLRSDIEVIKYLQKTGAYFDKEKIIHSYPHCMRCDTPIIYYALPSWFINIQKVKKDIIKKADAMNWVPTHLKEGRFKNIVENAPDWNVSRNRYWASPLPVWKCEKCAEKAFIGSLSDLKAKTKKSGNTYFLIRHGQSESNVKSNMHGIVSSRVENIDHLTPQGEDQVRETAKKLQGKIFDLVAVSPFVRTRDTLNILKEVLGFKDEQIIFDKRLGELDAGEFEGKPWDEYRGMFKNEKERFTDAIHGGESLLDVKKRVGGMFYEFEEKYQDKNILIISHGAPLWMLYSVLHGYNVDETIAMTGGLFRHSEEVEQGVSGKFRLFSNAEYRVVDFVYITHNANYELDLHRPYIDDIKLLCVCGERMARVPEVLDSWLESGSMPFAQDHYPFENPDWQKNNFPAGFVAEYIAQTRTWFYYSHVISTILFGHAPFDNVVTTGTLLAEDGQKISKSKKNYPDAWIFIDKYGVDALRIYLMASPLMKGEDANFSEKSVQEIASKIIGRLGNVVSFYELYRNSSLEAISHKLEADANILDQWIIARLNQLVAEVTHGMEAYDMNEASRPIENFIEDLSVWYLRRSRERIKNGEKEAKQTLYFVLKTVAKIIAPFAPFMAEDIWLRLKNENNEESVHLTEWPKAESFNQEILNSMQIIRELANAGHMLRQKLNMPVKQPLATFFTPSTIPNLHKEILKEELNVKNIEKGNRDFSYFDHDITPELKQEGNYRELVRGLQDMRKDMELTPSDVVALTFETSEEGEKLIKKFESDMKKTVLVSKIEFKKNDGPEIKIDDLVFQVKIVKI